jgi:hypothetical protein
MCVGVWEWRSARAEEGKSGRGEEWKITEKNSPEDIRFFRPSAPLLFHSSTLAVFHSHTPILPYSTWRAASLVVSFCA